MSDCQTILLLRNDDTPCPSLDDSVLVYHFESDMNVLFVAHPASLARVVFTLEAFLSFAMIILPLAVPALL